MSAVKDFMMVNKLNVKTKKDRSTDVVNLVESGVGVQLVLYNLKLMPQWHPDYMAINKFAK